MQQNHKIRIDHAPYRIEPLSFIFKKLTWRFRYHPSFLIIGAQKAGTTSLYEYLLRHPQIRPVYHREIHYFDINFHKSESWYRAHFPIHRPRFNKLERSLSGYATPYYLFHPLAPQRAARMYPQIKLICLLRDPVDRAFSHYNHNKRKKREMRSFKEAIHGEAEWLEKEQKRLIEETDYYSPMHHHFAYLARGIYIDQLQNWHTYFDSKNLLIAESGEFFNNTEKVLGEVCQFLDLDTSVHGRFKAHNKQRYISSLSEEIRLELSSYFKPHNQKLYQYLCRDLGWY